MAEKIFRVWIKPVDKEERYFKDFIGVNSGWELGEILTLKGTWDIIPIPMKSRIRIERISANEAVKTVNILDYCREKASKIRVKSEKQETEELIKKIEAALDIKRKKIAELKEKIRALSKEKREWEKELLKYIDRSIK